MIVPSIYQAMVAAIDAGEVEAGVAEAERLHASGRQVPEIFEEAIVPCLRDIGDRFSRLEIFLPDMMRAAAVVKGIHQALAPHLQGAQSVGSAGRVVTGTAYGDIHDIGKNIVISMLEVNGFEVYDLGTSVSALDFVKRAKELNADIIAVSSLLSTSMPYMKEVVEQVTGNEATRGRFKIMIGGGPVTEEYAHRIGADAYGENAADAVSKARALVSQRGPG